jgi:hypothetical protein
MFSHGNEKSHSTVAETRMIEDRSYSTLASKLKQQLAETQLLSRN